MRKSATLILLLILSTNIRAQLEIKFSEASKEFNKVQRFYPISKNEFQTVGVITSPSVYVAQVKYTDFKKTNSNKVKLGALSSKRLEDNALMNGQLVGFYSDKGSVGDNKSDLLYVEKYNKECLPDGNPVELLNIEIQKEWKNINFPWSVFASADESFFCIEYKMPSKKEEDKILYAYKIISKDLEVISEGTYQVPYTDEDSQFINKYLSNTGDYFLSYKVYKFEDKKKRFNKDTFHKVVLMQVKGNNVIERDMEFGDHRAMQMTYSSDADGVISITGVYGMKNATVNKGIFFVKYDFKDNNIIQSDFQTLPENFPNIYVRPYGFKIHDMIALSDGSLIGSIELYHVQTQSSSNGNGGSTVTYYYHYDEVITYKIKTDGSIGWINQLPKNQYSTNDDGVYSSIFSFVKNGKLIVMFNDNTQNYDANGIYNNETFYVKYSSKSNTVAYLEMDLETGQSIRKLALGAGTANKIAIPKKFKYDMKTNQVWMMFRPKRNNLQYATLEL